MSIGNPKRFDKLSKVVLDVEDKDRETGNDVTKVYKDPKHEMKKALKFKTDNDKSKLA